MVHADVAETVQRTGTGPGGAGANDRSAPRSQGALRIPLAGQFSLGLDPDKAQEFDDETLPREGAKPGHSCWFPEWQGV